jgi:aminomethyltransferase
MGDWLEKDLFRGSNVLNNQKTNGTTRVLKAIASTDRGIPRAGMQVKDSSGSVIGEVTSGTFSPTLKKGIGLALVNPTLAVGDQVVLDVRGRDSICEIVSLPFVASKVR